MSNSKLSSRLDSLLKCCVCKSTVSKPHTLGCYHSYCEACTIQLHTTTVGGETGIRCLVCNIFSGKKSMKSSSLMNSLVHMHSKMTNGEGSNDNKCETCLDSEAALKCVDCKMGLCMKCKAVHLRIPICRNHRIVEYTATDDFIIDSLVFCQVHPDEPIKFNCKSCEVALCIKCKVTKHENHQTETVEDALERLLPQVKEEMESLHDKIKAMDENHDKVCSTIGKIKEAFTDSRDEARNNLNDALEQAKKQHAKLVKELDAKEEAELAKLWEGKAALESQKNEYSQLCEWVAISTEAARGVNLMAEIQGGLYGHVQKLAQRTVVQPIKVKFPTVKVNYILQGMTDMAGTVTYRSTRANSYLKIFQDILQQSTIVSLAHSATRMDIINGDIWIPMPKKSSIKVVDQQGKVVKTIQVHQSQHDLRRNTQYNYYGSSSDYLIPYSVAQAYNGDIIVASNAGLLIIDEQGKVLTTLVRGTFQDVSVDKDGMVALNTGESQLNCFKLKDLNWQQTCVLKQNRQRNLKKKSNYNLTIACYCSSVYSTEHGVNEIVQVNQDKQTIIQHASQHLKNGFNYICGPDKAGNILIATNTSQPLQPSQSESGGGLFGAQTRPYDGYNQPRYKQPATVQKGRFTILQENGEFINTNTEIPGHVFDAVCDDDGNMWILHIVDENYRITKYI